MELSELGNMVFFMALLFVGGMGVGAISAMLVFYNVGVRKKRESFEERLIKIERMLSICQ